MDERLIRAGKRIKEERKKLGFTQTELGEKLGVNHSAVSKWENGVVGSISLGTIADMAELFGVQPSYIMGIEDATRSIDEIEEYLQMLHDRPELKLMFKASKKVSKEQVESIAQLMESIGKGTL